MDRNKKKTYVTSAQTTIILIHFLNLVPFHFHPEAQYVIYYGYTSMAISKIRILGTCVVPTFLSVYLIAVTSHRTPLLC